ncbi:MAG: GP88 family protein, partial [Bacteroidia bacterium]
YSAGHGAFSNVQQGRINKTLYYFNDRPRFLAELRNDIKKLVKKAEAQRMQPAVRLNGTSDLNWIISGIIEEFHTVQFYDYTKVFNRLLKPLPSNYHLTFSKSESNASECLSALKLGFNVAVVFNTPKGEQLPEFWEGYPVYDGDETDARFLDPRGGYVIGLRAKGQARKDSSGFVVDVAKFADILALEVN